MKLRAGRWVGLLALTWAAGFAQTQVLYVGDSGDGTIKRVDLSGNVSTYATGFSNIYGLAGDATGNLYVSSAATRKVVVIATSGSVTDYTTDFPSNANLLGMTFDAAGNLYIADVSAGVYKVLPGGSTSLWATGMSYPRDVAFNSSGVLYAVGGYNPMSMYSIASNGTATLFASQAASAGFQSIAFDSADKAYVGGSNSTFYYITTSGVVNSYLDGQNVTDVVYAGNGTFYFLAGGSLYRDAAGSISTLATGFSNATSLALVAVPEPTTTATVIGVLALVAVGWARLRRRGAD